MQITSIFVLSTTLLAAQVPAQFIRSMAPNLPTWSGQASHAVASSMATPSPSSSIVVASQPSHYMASHSFLPMVHRPMRPVARPSSSHSVVPAATPSASSTFNTQDQHQGLRQPSAQSPDQAYAVPDGGLAPIDPLQPGSDVAPVLIQKPTGIDEDQKFLLSSILHGDVFLDERTNNIGCGLLL
ncbi:hypothetical protein PENSUB_1636 [Penicillium subrubescens]|uniref:Uncharacterized protein n=1 Tax=Penicillium subrubescens TaxID=1316194 RepID=A0A1Q5UJN7_9EURO|nr:hypothetical protein PENSUB_1636 [Penicillium subrubescens]